MKRYPSPYTPVDILRHLGPKYPPRPSARSSSESTLAAGGNGEVDTVAGILASHASRDYIVGWDIDRAEEIVAALSAGPSARTSSESIPIAAGGAVKSLEWVQHPSAPIWRAETELGLYQVAAVSEPAWTFDGVLLSNGINKSGGRAETAAEAKAAAQADFQNRVLSCLSTYTANAGAAPVDKAALRKDYLSDAEAREIFDLEDDEVLDQPRIRVCEGEWVRILGGYYFDKSEGLLHPETVGEVERLTREIAEVREHAHRMEGLVFLADQALMELHGRFPLDEVTNEDRRLKQACRALRAITGPNHEERNRRADSTRAALTGDARKTGR